MPDPTSPKRNAESGYWGRGLQRRTVGRATFQLHEASAPPEAVTPHGHDHAHIVFVTSGPYVTSVTGENGFIDRPVAVLNPPSTYHRDHFLTGQGSFMTVDLKVDGLCEDYVRHCEKAGVIQFCNHLARTLADKTAIELEDDLSTLANLYLWQRPQDIAGVPPGIERAYDAIQDSREPWALSMADLAAIAGVHENHLPRAFRKRFGKTASHFASARQIELCTVAIATTEEPLADIAAQFGFYDQAHMSGRLRQRLGLSPSQWRAQALRQ
ncbi:hypothetical protein EH31_04080 [Erythrobacter longus]|uniref:HTH araC/xylS-type domain-containing protein n=1 Tax=Erythrobacter longus TaxID=1044 RepID=A0A074MJ17_ERYLO|nr:AraC family transcriptional regulator [Erythrobacter longus]KEO91858.1 hypothetical protein EH31_04080 [Erythrobacter longus]